MATPAEVSAALRRLEDALYVARIVGGRAAEREVAAARQALRALRGRR